jgi:photosystem II stability/assembly factor-like uncharacterized protein
MKKLLLLFSLIILSGIAQAQQWQQTTGVCGGYINCLATKGDTVFAGTSPSGLFISTDNGNTWASPAEPGLHWDILAIGFFDSKILAGGRYYSTDNGITWQDNNNSLGWVTAFGASDDTVFAGRDNGSLYSSPDGIIWSPHTTGISTAITSILVDDTTIYLAATYSGVYVSTNNGNTFSAFNTGFPPSTIVLSLVLHGTTVFAGTHEGVYFLPEGQSTWVEANTGLETTTAVRAITSDGFALYAGTDYHGIYKSTDNGATWHTVNTGLHSPTFWSLAINDSFIFCGTLGGGVYRSADAGSSWNAANYGLNAALTSSLVYDGTTMYAGTYGAGIFVSSDNGYTWQASNNGLTDYAVRDMVYNGTLVFAGTVEGGIFTSSDHGATWVQANNGLTNPRVKTLIAYAGEVFAGTGQGSTFITGGVYASLFKSIDNGTTWTRLDNGMAPDAQVYSIAIDEPYMYAGTWGDGVYVSDDMGANWATVQTDYPAPYIMALAVNGPRLVAGSMYNGLYSSADYANSWSPANSGPGMHSSTSANSLVFHDNKFYLGIDVLDLYVSDDNGGSWSDFSTGLPVTGNHRVNDFEFIGSTIFAALRGCGVWIYELPVGIEDVKYDAPEISIYPNPAISTLTIESAAGSKQSSVGIYNAQGQLVMQRELENSNLNLDISSLTTGLYYLHLHSAKGVAVKKFEVMR